MPAGLVPKRLNITKPFNSFLNNLQMLYSLKIPENQNFSGVFRGYEKETLI